jgi:hypothetical protein
MDFNLLYNKLIEKAIKEVSNSDKFSGSRLRELSSTPSTVTNAKKAQAIDRILDKGISYGDQGEEGVFIIASVETYLKAAEVGIRGDYDSYASIETNLKCFDALQKEATRLNPEFTTAIQNLLEIEEIMEDIILDKGIVEVGNFSVLQLLVNEGLASNGDIIDRILDKGIVLSRINGTVNIASVDTFLKYVGAAFGLDFPA